MSSQGSPTLEFDVAHRRIERLVAAACVLLAAMASALGAVVIAMPLPATVGAPFAAAGIAFLGFQSAGWLGRRHALQRIAWQADDRWFLFERTGALEATLRGDSRVGPRAAWLRWDVQAPRHGTRTLLLVPGDVSEPHLRRLATRLRIVRGGGMAHGAQAPAMAQER